MSSSVLERLGMAAVTTHQRDHEHHPHDSRHDLSLSRALYTHDKCPVRPGLKRKRRVVMIILIAAGDDGGA